MKSPIDGIVTPRPFDHTLVGDTESFCDILEIAKRSFRVGAPHGRSMDGNVDQRRVRYQMVDELGFGKVEGGSLVVVPHVNQVRRLDCHRMRLQDDVGEVLITDDELVEVDEGNP